MLNVLFFSAVDDIFGKLLNLASENDRLAIVELIRHKCISILLYGTTVSYDSNTDLCSLDFTFNRLLYVMQVVSIIASACNGVIMFSACPSRCLSVQLSVLCQGEPRLP